MGRSAMCLDTGRRTTSEEGGNDSMKGYRKMISQPASFDEESLAMGEFADTMDATMRGVMAEMINHAEDRGSRDYVIVVYAKRTKGGEHR